MTSRTLDLPTNGTALQRADVYTYRTADYAMSTTQAYQPGAFGNQEAIFQLILDPGVSLFHNHLPDHPGYGRSAVLDLEPVYQREDSRANRHAWSRVTGLPGASLWPTNTGAPCRPSEASGTCRVSSTCEIVGRSRRFSWLTSVPIAERPTGTR